MEPEPPSSQTTRQTTRRTTRRKSTNHARPRNIHPQKRLRFPGTGAEQKTAWHMPILWAYGGSGAANVSLAPDELRTIDEAAMKITLQGARYPEEFERMTGL